MVNFHHTMCLWHGTEFGQFTMKTGSGWFPDIYGMIDARLYMCDQGVSLNLFMS